MDWKKELYGKDEKPLERLVESYSYTSVFRTMAFIGDSLSSGEFQLRVSFGKVTKKNFASGLISLYLLTICA